MKKILVTGAQGYIGSVLLPYLKEKKYAVKGFDAGFFRDCSIIPLNEENIIYKNSANISADDLKGFDAVVHLSGIANDPLKTLDPDKVYITERRYTNEIAKLCKELGINLIYASSCSVYGAAVNEISDESSEPNPVTPYSMNKLNTESDLIEMSDKNFKPIMLRISTVMGFSPRIRFDIVVNMFVGMALATKKITLNSKGIVWRPFVHIKDVCKVIDYCIKTDLNSDDPLILNVGNTEENYKIIKIAEMVKESVPNSQIEFLQGNDELISDRKVQDGVDKRNYKLSFEKIKKVFPSFKCDWTLKDTINELIKELKGISLNEKEFRNINYYRLQKMEDLLGKKLLYDDFRWKEKMGESL